MSDTMTTPLLDEVTDTTEDEDRSKKILYRSYTMNAPKIMLETITARTITVCLIVTYSVFILATIIDLRNIIVGASKGNRDFSSRYCSDDIIVGKTEGDYGCISSTSVINASTINYVAHASDFHNVISISFSVTHSNISDSVTDDFILSKELSYDLRVYGCYENDNCGTVDDNIWKLIISIEDEVIDITEHYKPGDDDVKYYLLTNTFQNQEALPNQGKVKSYFFSLTYYSDTSMEYFNPTTTTYSFDTIERPYTEIADIMLPIFIIVTLFSFYYYVRIVRNHSHSIAKALPEQKWLIAYFIATLLNQNPIYCVIIWLDNPSPNAVYACYIMEAMASASIFTIWLFFADAFRRKKRTRLLFYTPKVMIGLSIFITNMIVLTLQFPSISGSDDTRSPILAVQNWSSYTKKVFIAFSLMYLFAILYWAITWFLSLYHTSKTLESLPYMSTRYLQLSFRFVVLVSSLLIVYYFCQIIVISYFIVELGDKVYSHNDILDSSTENINTLFREQTLTYGKMFFLTIYGWILAFFFLPAGTFDSKETNTVNNDGTIVGTVVTSLAATYVINESEIHDIVASRKEVLSKNKTLTQLTSAKAEVFCVDLALDLLEMAYQAYNDTPGISTDNGFGPIDLDTYDYYLLNAAYDEANDTVCYIVRHKYIDRVVVAFRGTCSKKHWTSNLKYSQVPVNLRDLKLPDVDLIDNLNITDTEIENFSDDEKSMETNRLTISGVTTDLLSSAATMTVNAAGNVPYLEYAVNSYIHEGFWEAYSAVRQFIHVALRVELKDRPAQVFCTGHSLGGALATITAIDLAINSIPRINAYLNKKNLRISSTPSIPPASPTHSPAHSDSSEVELTKKQQEEAARSRVSTCTKVEVALYNFGSPRVGNRAFATLFNRLVPNAFRIVVGQFIKSRFSYLTFYRSLDGDIVSGIPKTHYKHLGTEILIDRLGAGSIVIDQSFVERRLRSAAKTSIKVHSLIIYRIGLSGVKFAAEYLRDNPNADYGYYSQTHLNNDIAEIVLESSAEEESNQESKSHTGDINPASDTTSMEEKHNLAALSTQNSALLAKNEESLSIMNLRRNLTKALSQRNNMFNQNEDITDV